MGKFEIKPCAESTGNGDIPVEIVDEAQAQFYGVYRRDGEGFAVWVADFATRDDAAAFVLVKESAVYECRQDV